MLPYAPAEVVAILRSARTTAPDLRLEHLLDVFARRWRAFAVRKYPVLADAVDDVVQDALTSITSPRNVARLDDPDAVEAWANRIFSNRCVDYLRERRATITRQLDLTDEDDGNDDVLRTRLPSQEPDPEELVARQQRLAIIRRAIDEAPIARLKFIEGRSDEEIGLALGKSTDAVSSWLKRFRKALKRDLSSPDGE